ncbi:hypothetical protein [Nonomuraea sp. JJY05]|uniref:hypothetical protein n=1 Tax=Nonomuraea sp. JJY05 TaxID=3350255 RepID=UPI00373F0836
MPRSLRGTGGIDVQQGDPFAHTGDPVPAARARRGGTVSPSAMSMRRKQPLLNGPSPADPEVTFHNP